MYVSPLHCIYYAPSRILAFWLMLSVLCTTINKVYLILSYLTSIGIPIIKIRRSQDHLIFIMENLHTWKDRLYIETWPGAIPIIKLKRSYNRLILSPVNGEFPTQKPETRSFDVSFDLRLNTRFVRQVIWDAIVLIMTSLWWEIGRITCWHSWCKERNLWDHLAPRYSVYACRRPWLRWHLHNVG